MSKDHIYNQKGRFLYIYKKGDEKGTGVNEVQEWEKGRRKMPGRFRGETFSRVESDREHPSLPAPQERLPVSEGGARQPGEKPMAPKAQCGERRGV